MARGSRSFSRREIRSKRRGHHLHERLREESEPDEPGHQQYDRQSQACAEIDNLSPALIDCAHERRAVSEKHINVRDHDAPTPEHPRHLENVEALHFPPVSSRAKETQAL